MKRLLILEKNAPTYVEEVTGRDLPELEIFSAGSVDEGLRYISEVDIILGRPEFVAPLLQHADQTAMGTINLCRYRSLLR